MSKVRFRSLLASAAVAFGVAAPAAHAAYGPENPQPVSAPGGYTQVVTSRVLGPSGGQITGAATGLQVTVNVTRGVLSSPLQLVVVKPRLGDLTAAIHRGGLRRDKVIAGFGLGASALNGAAVGRFGHALKLVLNVGKAAADAIVLRYDQAKHAFVRASFTRGKGGVIVVSTMTPGAFAVVVPPASRPHAHHHVHHIQRHMRTLGV